MITARFTSHDHVISPYRRRHHHHYYFFKFYKCFIIKHLAYVLNDDYVGLQVL